MKVFQMRSFITLCVRHEHHFVACSLSVLRVHCRVSDKRLNELMTRKKGSKLLLSIIGKKNQSSLFENNLLILDTSNMV